MSFDDILAADGLIIGHVGPNKGKTEHNGPRDMSRKLGHWGDTGEAKAWAGRARRRDETEEIARAVNENQVGQDA